MQMFNTIGEPTFGLVTDNYDETYTVDVNASESGLHKVFIELDNKPVPGSPFSVRIVQAADKKKVRLYGVGLESGTLDNYQDVFHVDTKGAGPGNLKVQVHGPKGGFDVRISRDNPADRIINVRYNPTLPGIYTISVLWADEHVDGSPHELFISPNASVLSNWHEDPALFKSKLDIGVDPVEYETQHF